MTRCPHKNTFDPFTAPEQFTISLDEAETQDQMTRYFFHILSIVLFAIHGSVSCADGIEISGPTMGTHYRIVVDSPPDNLDAEALQGKISARLDEINRQMSTWDDTSQISKFNQSDSTDWFDVSSEFATVVAEAKRIHELTGGAFDPTVEPLIKLWGFGDGRKKAVPAEVEIKAAKTMIGMQHVEVRADPPALKKAVPDLQLNLSAIAKGYGVDAIAALLTDEGLPSFVVDIGGENKVGTAKASGDSWKLGVESPLGGLRRIVELTESSIATSGDYRNYFQMDGVTYSHAINPVTGWPVREPPASVSVVAESCMTADAWATAMMILGVDAGGKVADENQLSVMFQQVQDDADVQEKVYGVFAVSAEEATSALPNGATSDPADAKSARLQRSTLVSICGCGCDLSDRDFGYGNRHHTSEQVDQGQLWRPRGDAGQ